MKIIYKAHTFQLVKFLVLFIYNIVYHVFISPSEIRIKFKKLMK